MEKRFIFWDTPSGCLIGLVVLLLAVVVVTVGVIHEVSELTVLAVGLVVLGAVVVLGGRTGREEAIVTGRGDDGGEVTGEADLRWAIPPPTRLNWILTWAMGLAFLLLLPEMESSPGLFMFGGWGGLLVLGVWRIRPRRGEERFYDWIMLPVTAQAIVYLVLSTLLAVRAATSWWWNPPGDLEHIVASLAGILVLIGPLSLIFLPAFTTRYGILVLAEVLGPVLFLALWLGPLVIDALECLR
jgi:hypothetical protein